MPEITDTRREPTKYRIINAGRQPLSLQTPKREGCERITIEIGSVEDRMSVDAKVAKPEVEVDGDVWRAIRGRPGAKLVGGQKIVQGLLDARTLYEYPIG